MRLGLSTGLARMSSLKGQCKLGVGAFHITIRVVLKLFPFSYIPVPALARPHSPTQSLDLQEGPTNTQTSGHKSVVTRVSLTLKSEREEQRWGVGAGPWLVNVAGSGMEECRSRQETREGRPERASLVLPRT